MTLSTLQGADTLLSFRILAASDRKLSLDVSIPDVFRCAGMAQFEISDDGALVCNLVMVDSAHRNKGIASAMFEHAEQHFQRSVTPGLALTPDLVGFYRARSIDIPPGAQIMSFADLFSAPH